MMRPQDKNWAPIVFANGIKVEKRSHCHVIH